MKNVCWVLRELGFLENVFVMKLGVVAGTRRRYCQSSEETLNWLATLKCVFIFNATRPHQRRINYVRIQPALPPPHHKPTRPSQNTLLELILDKKEKGC